MFLCSDLFRLSRAIHHPAGNEMYRRRTESVLKSTTINQFRGPAENRDCRILCAKCRTHYVNNINNADGTTVAN